MVEAYTRSIKHIYGNTNDFTISDEADNSEYFSLLQSDSERIEYLLGIAKKGKFLSLDEELYLGKLIFDSNPWNYPIEPGKRKKNPRSYYGQPSALTLKYAQEAKYILYLAYIRLVNKQVYAYFMKNNNVLSESDKDEVKSNALIGFANALKNYDYRRKCKFSNALSLHVFRDMVRGSVSLPCCINVSLDIVRKMLKTRSLLEQNVPIEQAVKKTGFTVDKYNSLETALSGYSSLDAPVDSSNINDPQESDNLLDSVQNRLNGAEIDFYESTDVVLQVEKQEKSDKIKQILLNLAPIDRETVLDLYYRNKTDAEIMRAYGMNSQKWKAHKARVYDILRNLLEEENVCSL